MIEDFPIIGGGPAGASAALALCRAGVRPVVYEKSPFPRHKVCGEFLSPEILPALARIGMAERFLAAGPARITHVELRFERRVRRFELPEPAYGLSRYALDHLLLSAAAEHGAVLRRAVQDVPDRPAICAVGRRFAGVRGSRVFGFKAQFAGLVDPAVQLYFFRGGYCGIGPVERGAVNVCGLAAESLLRERRFRLDALLGAIPRLSEQLSRIERRTRWLVTGPIRYGRTAGSNPRVLPAGDAAHFADPFTGTGVLAAVYSGIWAAEVALEDGGWLDRRNRYLARCRNFFLTQSAVTALFRRALDLGWAESLSGVLPGSLLYRLTRPACNPR